MSKQKLSSVKAGIGKSIEKVENAQGFTKSLPVNQTTNIASAKPNDIKGNLKSVGNIFNKAKISLNEKKLLKFGQSKDSMMGTLGQSIIKQMNDQQIEKERASILKKAQENVSILEQISLSQQHTLLFVNNTSKKLGKNEDQEADTEMELHKHLFNLNEKTRVINSEQQQLLNNEMDVMITQMFEAFISQRPFMKLKQHNARHDEIDSFFNNSKTYIHTFKVLFKRVWPQFLSDFKYKQRLHKIKKDVIEMSDTTTLGMGSVKNLTKFGHNLTKDLGQIGRQVTSQMSQDMSSRRDQDDARPAIQKEASSDSSSFQTESSCQISENQEDESFNDLEDEPKSDNLSSEKKKILQQRLLAEQMKQITALKDHSTFMMLTLAFSCEDFHEMFKRFYKKYADTFQFGKVEVMTLFEHMSSKDLIGKERMRLQVLPILGVYVRAESSDAKDINVSMIKHTFINGYNLSVETHLEIYNSLSNGEKYVKLQQIMPYLMVFFLAEQQFQIDKRKARFFQMLDPSKCVHNEVSLVSGLRNQGIKEEDLYKKILTYRDIEHFLIDYKSKFPATYSNNSMTIIMRMTKERMDVDPISGKESFKESFYEIDEDQTEQYGLVRQTNIADRFKSEEDNAPGNLQRALTRKFTMASKKRRQTQVLQRQLSTQEGANEVVKKLCGFNIDNHNRGLGIWLAYQLALQLMVTAIQNKYEIKVRGENGKQKQALAYENLKTVPKYIYEEKLWYLVMNHYDQTAFVLQNFNMIVKQTLFRMSKPQLLNMHYHARQSLSKKNKRNSLMSPEIKTDQKKLKLKNKVDPHQYLKHIPLHFLMFQYIECVQKVLSKSIMEDITYKQVEEAVFLYVTNLVQKCESILLEQYEQQMLLAELQEILQLHNSGSQADQIFDVCEIPKYLIDQIVQRYTRIHGKNCEQIKKLRKSLNKKNSDQVAIIKDAIKQIKTYKSWLDNKEDKKMKVKEVDSYFSTFDVLDVAKFGQQSLKLKEIDILQQSKKKLDSEIDSQKQQIEKAPTYKSLDHSDEEDHQIEKQQKSMKAQQSIDIFLQASRFDRQMKEQNLGKSIQKRRMTSLNLPEKQLVNKTNKLIENLFVHSESNLAEKDIFTQEQQRLEGENLLSKSNNKFYFRLLQIFGFRDDPPMSFINKDLMKFEYFQARKNKPRLAENFFEQFQIAHSIENLTRWKREHLKSVTTFRAIILQTNAHIDWNQELIHSIFTSSQPPNEMESDQDIFNFSLKIIQKHCLRMNAAYSTNILHNLSLSTYSLKKEFEKMWEPISDSQKRNMVRNMIQIKQDIEDKAQDIRMEEKVQNKKFNFHERVRYEQIYQQKLDMKEQTVYNRKTALQEGQKNTTQSTICKRDEHAQSCFLHAYAQEEGKGAKLEEEIGKGKALDLMLTNFYFNGLLDQKAIQKQKRDKKKPSKKKYQNRVQEDFYASGKIKFNLNDDEEHKRKHKKKVVKAKEWVKVWDQNDSVQRMQTRSIDSSCYKKEVYSAMNSQSSVNLKSKSYLFKKGTTKSQIAGKKNKLNGFLNGNIEKPSAEFIRDVSLNGSVLMNMEKKSSSASSSSSSESDQDDENNRDSQSEDEFQKSKNLDPMEQIKATRKHIKLHKKNKKFLDNKFKDHMEEKNQAHQHPYEDCPQDIRKMLAIHKEKTKQYRPNFNVLAVNSSKRDLLVNKSFAAHNSSVQHISRLEDLEAEQSSKRQEIDQSRMIFYSMSSSVQKAKEGTESYEVSERPNIGIMNYMKSSNDSSPSVSEYQMNLPVKNTKQSQNASFSQKRTASQYQVNRSYDPGQWLHQESTEYVLTKESIPTKSRPQSASNRKEAPVSKKNVHFIEKNVNQSQPVIPTVKRIPQKPKNKDVRGRQQFNPYDDSKNDSALPSNFQKLNRDSSARSCGLGEDDSCNIF